jgi:alpha-mannosidase
MAFTLKRAEDGDGLIVRLIEVAGQATAATLITEGLPLVAASRTDIVERDIEALPVAGGRIGVSLPAFGIETVRLRLAH